MQDKDSSFPEKLKTFQAICKELGLKLTHQRLELFDVLMTAKDHPSAEAVYQRAKSKMPTIAFDTVYRTLALFDRCGVIARLQHLDDRTRYDQNLTLHHHLVCIKCKDIQDFPWPAVDEMEIPNETNAWGLIQGKYLELRGICRDCLERESREERN